MQIVAMRLASIATSAITTAFTGLIFWADNASAGDVILGAIVVGLAVLFTAQKVRSAWAKSAVAAIYLASVALCGVVAHLLNKALGEHPGDEILGTFPTIFAVGLGWAICDAMRKANEQTV